MKKTLQKKPGLVRGLVPGLLLGSLSAGVARADPVPEVQRFLQEEIVKLQTVQDPRIGPPGAYAHGTYGYNLTSFRLRLRAEFGFDVGVAKVTLQPFAEFFWE